MFVVAGVTGHVGAVAADALLAQGQKVRVVVRSQEKGAPWKAKGAEVAIADLDDEVQVASALEGAKGAFLLLPPDLKTTTTIADKARMTATLGRAIERAKVPHVVFLSSIAAHRDAGTGPIRTVAHAERELGKITSTRFTWLRPAYFVENLGALVGAVRSQGVLPVMWDLDKRVAVIATRDIGEAAARALVEGPSEGRASIIELAGPRDVTFAELAKEIGAILGREIQPVRVPAEAVAGALQQAGINADLAGLYAEMSAGVNDGTVSFEGNGARFVRGKVEAHEVLKALFA